MIGRLFWLVKMGVMEKGAFLFSSIIEKFRVISYFFGGVSFERLVVNWRCFGDFPLSVIQR